VLVQVVLEYIDKKTRAMQQSNQVAAWAMCMVRGLIWLLEKIVAFINRNAFILVAGEIQTPQAPSRSDERPTCWSTLSGAVGRSCLPGVIRQPTQPSEG
jgi:hypothetical protein